MTGTGTGGRGNKGKGQDNASSAVVACRQKPAASRGFTLLEVMVAVAILGMVLVTLMGVKNRSMQDVALAERITTATMLATRKMNETLLAPGTIAAVQNEDEGEFPEEEFKDYMWKQSISELQPFENIKVTEVLVAVLWKEGERQEMVELKSYQ